MNSGASGSGTADFTSTTTTYINPDWTVSNGEVYEIQNTTSTAPELDITAS
jgi:hypothetical protein